MNDTIGKDFRLEKLKEDVKHFGVMFNFKDGEKLRTAIIRKGQWNDNIFKNGFVPEQWSRLTRKQRRHL